MQQSVKHQAMTRIRQARRRAGYSQTEVAARMGISLKEYKKVESLEKPLKPAQIDFLQNELKFKQGYLTFYSLFWRKAAMEA